MAFKPLTYRPLLIQTCLVEQVRAIATDRLREAFKDVQPQLEKPYNSGAGISDGRTRHEQNEKIDNNADEITLSEK